MTAGGQRPHLYKVYGCLGLRKRLVQRTGFSQQAGDSICAADFCPLDTVKDTSRRKPQLRDCQPPGGPQTNLPRHFRLDAGGPAHHAPLGRDFQILERQKAAGARGRQGTGGRGQHSFLFPSLLLLVLHFPQGWTVTWTWDSNTPDSQLMIYKQQSKANQGNH